MPRAAVVSLGGKIRERVPISSCSPQASVGLTFLKGELVTTLMLSAGNLYGLE
jgi:hypothetical protein